MRSRLSRGNGSSPATCGDHTRGAVEPEPHAIPELVSRLGSGEPAPVDLGPERLGRAVQKALTVRHHPPLLPDRLARPVRHPARQAGRKPWSDSQRLPPPRTRTRGSRSTGSMSGHHPAEGFPRTREVSVTDGSEALLARALTDSVAERASPGKRDGFRLLHRLVDAARYHRVMNMVHLSLKEIPGPSESDLREVRNYLHQIGHHLRALSDLRSLDAVLSERGILAAREGPGPVRDHLRALRSPGLQRSRRRDPTGDVPSRDRLACRVGFRPPGSQQDLIRREHRAQLHLSLRLGTVADVHHHLLNRATVRHSHAPMRDLFERSTPVVVGECGTHARCGRHRAAPLHPCEPGGRRSAAVDEGHRAVAPSAGRLGGGDPDVPGPGPLVGVVLERARSRSALPSPGRCSPRCSGHASVRRFRRRSRWPASRARPNHALDRLGTGGP